MSRWELPPAERWEVTVCAAVTRAGHAAARQLAAESIPVDLLSSPPRPVRALTAYLLMAKKKSKTLKCPLCDKYFRREEDRQQHILAAKIHQTSYAPPTSGALVPTTSHTVPQAITAGDPEAFKRRRQWACHLCDAIVFSPIILSKHYNQVHPTGASLAFRLGGFCTPCDAFVNKGTASMHFSTSSNHPKCFVCNEGFKDQAHLLKHMSTRNTCEACRIHFSSAQALQEHNQNTHFACGTCGERFLSLDELVPHRLLSNCAIAAPSSRNPEPKGPAASVTRILAGPKARSRTPIFVPAGETEIPERSSGDEHGIFPSAKHARRLRRSRITLRSS
ncbi:hypothetical protein OH77DRAFT_679901 [Trametes cingulata]|nr:hypothetical protein OH77DRAFT_679901 [Trametes cingulata]